MSRKTEFKENSGSKSLTDSAKRRKMSESVKSTSRANFSSDLGAVDEEDSSALSVTVYEDDNDLSYYNKSSVNRLAMSSSFGKRSPLATINQMSQQPIPSTSSYVHPPAKTPSKVDETFVRRFQVKESPHNPFQLLSDEVLLHILTFLPKKALNRLAQVNQRFSRIIQDETLWIRMDIFNKPIRSGAIGRIIGRGLIILRLAQSKIQSPIFEPDFGFDGYQCKLQYLDLSMASIDLDSLKQLLSVCRSLKKLSLEFVVLNEDVCEELAENENLEVLNLAMCEGLTLEAVKLLMTKLQNLLALNISWTSLEIDTIAVLVSTISPTIMRLNIAGCRKSLQDKHLKTLSERCPNIVELDVSDCSLLTSESIRYISNFPKMEYLSLSRCYSIAMTSYLTLNSIKTLLYLDVFGLLSDSGLAHMEKAFKSIGINRFMHSSVARPTCMPRRTSIWGLKTRDS